MYELKNINKTYEINKSNKLEALKEINIKLPNKGLIVILGESGSGKTTLMNLLGGLDLPTSGEIWFNNECLNQEKSQSKILKKLDEYKRNNISFIFQDFNLINKLNIEDNLKLGLTFNGSEEKISEVLEEVGLKGYEKRYPKDISGGEHQRVAIARGLLKKAKVILADEPTGNLDKKNGEEIIKILKNISKEKLVIVVSHNEELVKPYSDGIIRLEDGKIIEQKINTTEEEINIEETENKKTISNKVAFKLAFHNLGVRKARLILTFLILTICYTFIAIPIAFAQYKAYKVHYKVLAEKNYSAFKIKNMNADGYDYLKSLDEIKYPDVVTSKNQLIDLGYEFYPDDVEFKEGCIYISDKMLESEIRRESQAIINGEEVTLNEDVHQITDLIGNKILMSSDFVTVSGIYYYPSELYHMQAPGEDRVTCENFYVYLKKKYIEYNAVHKEPKYDRYNAYFDQMMISPKLGKHMISKFDIEKNDESTGRGFCLITSDQIYNDLSTAPRLKDNECYINFAEYCYETGTRFPLDYYVQKDESTNKYQLINKMPNLGYKVDCKFVNRDEIFHKNKIEYKNLIVKGVYFNEDDHQLDLDNEDTFNNVYFNQKLYDKLDRYRLSYSDWILTDSVKDLKSFMRIMETKYGAEFFTPASKIISQGTTNTGITSWNPEGYQLIGLIVGIPILIITILITISLISLQIYDRKKEIGILKSLGGRSKEILKIYAYELIYLLIPVFVFTSIITASFVNKYNALITKNYDPAFVYIQYEFINLPIMIVIIVVISFIMLLIPLRKINKLSTIKAIKE